MRSALVYVDLAVLSAVSGLTRAVVAVDFIGTADTMITARSTRALIHILFTATPGPTGLAPAAESVHSVHAGSVVEARMRSALVDIKCTVHAAVSGLACTRVPVTAICAASAVPAGRRVTFVDSFVAVGTGPPRSAIAFVVVS